MTREEAINEINKVFTSAYANYIVTALTEGATVSDIQRRYGRAYEAGVKGGLKQEPCEDAVSRKSVIAIIQNHWWNCRDIDKLVNELPPVTPQEPNTWSLDDAREDFMHDVYNELDFLPTNEEANRIIDIFDRVTSSIEQAPRWIPVTERLPEEGQMVIACYPSDCGKRVMTAYYYNKECGFSCGITYAWMPLPEPYKGGE